MNRHDIERILLRCIIYGFTLLLIWFISLVVFGEYVITLHGMMFELSRQEFHLVHYQGMTLLKILVLVIFVFPYLAIRFGGGSLDEIGKPEEKGR